MTSKKVSAPRGRPSKGAAANVKTIQVRVSASTERHVKAKGGSAFVRTLIEKSMYKSATSKPAKTSAIKNGPNEKAVKIAMKEIQTAGVPPKVKKAAAVVGPYKEAADKEKAARLAKPKPPSSTKAVPKKTTTDKKK